jgi:outer membrane protein OmpA-like peptidoglycan-associated protein
MRQSAHFVSNRSNQKRAILMLKHSMPRWSLPGLLLAAVLWPGVCQAQVQFFDRVPTPQEIQDALTGRSSADAPAGMDAGPQFKTRGIEWNAPDAALEASKVARPVGGAGLAFPLKFDSGAARVSVASLAYIDAVAQTLLRNPDMRLTIEGHTDAAGSPRANVMLSWERAFSVFRLMVDKYGIDPARLQPAGKGASEPLVPTDKPDAMNRRVQFRLASQG